MAVKKRSLLYLAQKINAHLKRLEADEDYNLEISDGRTHIVPLYMPGACVAGRYVSVTYVTYQGDNSLTRDQADAYLTWLDAGNKGRHHNMDREVENG